MPDNEHPFDHEALLISFRRERETKNTIRYEELASDMPPVVGTLYLQKWALHRLGEPEVISVSITAAPSWFDRDGLARLDRNEADVLVAAKIDQVSRSTTDFARLLDQAEKKGWKLVVLDADVDTTTAAGRLLVDVVSSAASFESRRIGERAKSVHAVRRSQGKRAGQAPLLSDAVRLRIAGEHAEGKSLNAIAATLNAEGVPAAKGGKWYASTIRHVLRSVEVDEELAKVQTVRA
jgi:DNA invertase Pin-like site-specific DNA recombinase